MAGTISRPRCPGRVGRGLRLRVASTRPSIPSTKHPRPVERLHPKMNVRELASRVLLLELRRRRARTGRQPYAVVLPEPGVSRHFKNALPRVRSNAPGGCQVAKQSPTRSREISTCYPEPYTPEPTPRTPSSGSFVSYLRCWARRPFLKRRCRRENALRRSRRVAGPAIKDLRRSCAAQLDLQCRFDGGVVLEAFLVHQTLNPEICRGETVHHAWVRGGELGVSLKPTPRGACWSSRPARICAVVRVRRSRRACVGPAFRGRRLLPPGRTNRWSR